MTLTLPAWLAAVDGVRIDRDGRFPAKDPYQCWDLWADYAEQVVGAPLADTYTNRGSSKPHGGYACNVFHNFDRVPALRSRFDLLGPDAAAQPGDVAFWERGGIYAGSHVAIVVADRGAVLRCMSQNKGPGLDAAAYEVLSKRTLLGYLRPKTKATAPAPPTPQLPKGAPRMFLMQINDPQDARLWLVKPGSAARVRTPQAVQAVRRTLTHLGLPTAELKVSHAEAMDILNAYRNNDG